MEFLEFVLSTLRTFTVVHASCNGINFISKYLECWLFCEKENIYFEKEIWSFFSYCSSQADFYS